MGQNPVNPRPDLPQQGQPGPGPARAPFAQPGPPYTPRAGQPVPGASYPYLGSPGQAYAPTGSPPYLGPRKKSSGLVAGLIAGAVALVLVAGGVIAFLVITKTTPVSSEPDKATTSAAALQGYLETVATGNADKAKQYAMNAPPDSPFLTSDFLKAAVAKNPITEIQVSGQKDAGTSAYVSASYKLGATLVQGNYHLTKAAKIWKLDSVVTTMDRPSYWGTLGVTVNGTPAPASRLAFFPGVYQLSTGTSLLAFQTPMFTVKEPDDHVAGLSSSEPTLTDAGKKTMITKAQSWLTQCLAAQDTNPQDCGMNTPLPSGATLAPGSLKRTVDSTTAPFSDATPRVSYDDPTKVTMTTYVSVKVSAADTAGITYSGSTSVSSATGTIDGENITVAFTD